MILLVGVGEKEIALDTDRRVTRVPSPADADVPLSDSAVEVVVVQRTVVGAAGDELIRAIRQGRYDDPTVPLVVLADESLDESLPILPIDDVLSVPVDGASLRAAIERAEKVAAYKRAVHAFFEGSQQRASEPVEPLEEDASLSALRELADDRLGDLEEFDEPDLISALLWRPEQETETRAVKGSRE